MNHYTKMMCFTHLTTGTAAKSRRTFCNFTFFPSLCFFFVCFVTLQLTFNISLGFHEIKPDADLLDQEQ